MPTEPLVFRNKPVEVKLGEGENQKVITVKDLPYGKHKELLRKLSDIFIERAAFPQMVEKESRNVQKLMITDNKTAEEIGDIFMDKVKDLYMHLSNENVVDLLTLMTEGKLTESDIENFESGEVLGLTQYLLDRNIKALKNLFASLDDTQMQPKERN